MADIYNPEITGDAFMDEKVLAAYNISENMEKRIEECEKEFHNTLPKTDKDVCSLMETVNSWSGIVQKITDVISSTSGTIQVFSGFENCIAMQIVLKHIQLCLLKAKRLILKVKLKIAIFTKKLVEAMIAGKGSGVPDPISTAVNTAFTVLGIAVNAVLTVIEMFMKMISLGPIGIDAQSMVFFMTPKSFNNTKAPAYNTNSAASHRLPDAIKTVIREIETSVDKINSAIKIAAISAGAVAGAASILTKHPEFGINSKLNKLRPGELQKKIDLISDFLPIPIGLPRYEKLKFTNLGFLAFLITGFEPAAHKSFGIPGYF
jgi:hypothetical protein